MNVVLDTSGAIEIFDMTQKGGAFLDIILHAEKVLAPDLYISEIANTAWKRNRRKENWASVSIQMGKECINYIREYADILTLWEEALNLAHEYDHSVYDMLYAALAKRHDAVLITLDEPLRKVCEQIPVRCAPIY